MKQNVTIRVINPVENGISQTTGMPWVRQSVVVSWPEMSESGELLREHFVKASLNAEGIDRMKQLQPGMQVEADLDFHTESYMGKVHNRVTMLL